MAETSSGTGQPVVPAVQPPAKVAEAAATRSLGACVQTQKGPSPIGNFLFGISAAAGLVLVAMLLNWVVSAIHWRLLAFLAFLCIAFALIVIVYSFMALLAGFTATYLYTHGLIHVKNGKVQTVTWQELDELWLWKAGGKAALAGKLLTYYVVTYDGRKVLVEAASAKGDKSLGERLQKIVRERGRPVKDSGPYVGRMRP